MLISGFDPRGGSGATNVVGLTDSSGTTIKEMKSYSITFACVRGIGFTSDGSIFVAGTDYVNTVSGVGFVDIFASTGERWARHTARRSSTAVTRSVDGDY